MPLKSSEDQTKSAKSRVETNPAEFPGETIANILQNDTQITSEVIPEAKERNMSEPEGSHLDTGSHLSPRDLSDLGRSRLTEFRDSGALGDLEQAIAYFSRAIALTPDGHPHMSYWLANLGVSYSDRYRRRGKVDDLDKAVEYDSRALALTPDGHPRMSQRLGDLGAAYTDRYKRMGDLDDLDKSIDYFSRALTLTPDDHPDMSQRLGDLGASYTNRYKRMGDLDDLEKSIDYFSRALALTPDGHPHMSHQLSSIGASYTNRYKRMGDLDDLEKSIDYRSRALACTPDSHPDMSHLLSNLGASHTDRYKSMGDLDDIEKSIDYRSRALRLTPDGHQNMAYRLASLGVSYTGRYQRMGDLDDLEKSIEYFSRALALTPDGHPKMSDRLASLGASYSDRYQHLGDVDDLEKSIDYNSRALALTPDGHPHMSQRLSDLGVSYTNQYRHMSDLDDLEKSIDYFSRALVLTPDGHPHMSYRLAILGVSYTGRYQRLGNVGDLEKSIDYNSRALGLTPDGHPNMSYRLADLGVSYTDRYKRVGDIHDLDKAVDCSSRALALTPDGHPNLLPQHLSYAEVLLHQYRRTAHPSYLFNCLNSFRSASQFLTGAPRVKFQNALQWANQACDYSDLNPMEAYQTTINLLPQFIWLGATTKQRYQDLSATEHLAVNACYAAIQSEDYSVALEWLEHARCVVWNQSLMLRSPLDELHSSHPDLATQLETLAGQLHSSSFDARQIQADSSDPMAHELAVKERRRLATEYHNLLAQIRQLPGLECFLRPTKTNTLMHLAQSGPIVVINCHSNRCDALFVLPGHDEIRHLSLPDFTEELAKKACSGLESSLRKQRLRQRGFRIMQQPEYEDQMGSVLQTLWCNIVQPVLNYLGYMVFPREPLPHITWCPTGSLSFLPLHAAGDYSQPRSRVFDYVVSSYTPTLTALIARTSHSLSQDCRVLAIGQASTPEHTPLPGTVQELSYVKAHAAAKAEYLQLTDDQATTTAVLNAMEQHNWVHFACHAHQNVKDPTMSGFYLHNGTLDLSVINQRSFRNKGLAFLSACETATGDEKLPDEAIHLASGMLMAGYPSVIATMWSVADNDAPFVADKVYAQLMRDMKIGNGEAGRALHYAIAGLREKVGEKEFGRWVPYIHIGS
ncbi:aromatic di-alanine and TPR containing protein [Rhizoctonia solani 123E]|uniref:Aromatic di-alanine and TPR containing protein n=1 Tax=Rhizoctonia solani 123E TaxID=1423351 RepID=A0A074S9Y8_9AGAM|nr:aromatic di-alanine and TPR containing protein [Rhizoctonia solani 123E]